MKTGMFKYLTHEVEYVGIATLAVIVLSVMVFPIFLAFLPLVIIIGCTMVWRLDHTRNKPQKS